MPSSSGFLSRRRRCYRFCHAIPHTAITDGQLPRTTRCWILEPPPGRGRGARKEGGGLDLGFRVADGHATHRHETLSNTRRTMHIAVLGKTGTGKSSLLRYSLQQDIEADRGFLYFDLHGDADALPPADDQREVNGGAPSPERQADSRIDPATRRCPWG